MIYPSWNDLSPRRHLDILRLFYQITDPEQKGTETNIAKGVDKCMFYLFRQVHYIEVDMDDDEEAGGIYYAIQVNLKWIFNAKYLIMQ